MMREEMKITLEGKEAQDYLDMVKHTKRYIEKKVSEKAKELNYLNTRTNKFLGYMFSLVIGAALMVLAIFLFCPGCF